MGGRHYLLGQLLAAISAPGLRTRGSLFLPYFGQDLVGQWTLGRDFFFEIGIGKLLLILACLGFPWETYRETHVIYESNVFYSFQLAFLRFL